MKRLHGRDDRDRRLFVSELSVDQNEENGFVVFDSVYFPTLVNVFHFLLASNTIKYRNTLTVNFHTMVNNRKEAN